MTCVYLLSYYIPYIFSYSLLISHHSRCLTHITWYMYMTNHDRLSPYSIPLLLFTDLSRLSPHDDNSDFHSLCTFSHNPSYIILTTKHTYWHSIILKCDIIIIILWWYHILHWQICLCLLNYCLILFQNHFIFHILYLCISVYPWSSII